MSKRILLPRSRLPQTASSTLEKGPACHQQKRGGGIGHLTKKKIGHLSNIEIPQMADAQISHLWYNVGEVGSDEVRTRTAAEPNRWAAKPNTLEKKIVICLATTNSAKNPIVPE